MLVLLWHVAYCCEFPTQLAKRIEGHPQWNRHVMYRAIKKHYVEVYRCTFRQRTIRSMRITDEGLAYIAEREPDCMPLLIANQSKYDYAHTYPERVARMHAVATGMVMAENAGAFIRPQDKPSLLNRGVSYCKPDRTTAYYYSVREIREAIQDYNTESVAKTSRILGAIVRGDACYCLYYTGYSRIYWRQTEEQNSMSAATTVLNAAGFPCTSVYQVLIGTTFRVAESIASHKINGRSRYFTISDKYGKCHFLSNDENGDALFRLILDSRASAQFEHAVMFDHYLPPEYPTRSYDAVTPDGRRPVILAYQYDLIALLNMDKAPPGFDERPIVLCLDYQVESIQKIVGPNVEVQAIPELIPK